MKFKKIKAGNFGCLKNWESPDIENNFVVIYGRNESGKTTIFKLISTLLYGWNPVSNNPCLPWDGTAADCSGTFLDVDGREINVYRKLRSRPEGIVTYGDKKQELGNKAITQAA